MNDDSLYTVLKKIICKRSEGFYCRRLSFQRAKPIAIGFKLSHRVAIYWQGLLTGRVFTALDSAWGETGVKQKKQM